MKKLSAIVLTLAMLLAFASCGAKEEETTTSAPEETVTEEITATETTEITEETETASDAEEASEVSETAASEAADGETTKAEETKAEEKTTVAAPSTKAEILSAYNAAVNNAYSKKAGFKKERYTDNENYDMSLALNAFKSLVEKFIGIGDDNKYEETVEKGNWDTDAKREYLRKSTLTEADLTGATCKTDGKYYIVTLNINGGNSIGSKDSKSTNAPLDKCGICVGNEDKGYYDHKTGEVIYDAIAGTYEGASIKESYSDAKAVAKIDSTTGNLVALTVTFNINVDIDISIGSGTATGTTHVLYTDFKY